MKARLRALACLLFVMAVAQAQEDGLGLGTAFVQALATLPSGALEQAGVQGLPGGIDPSQPFNLNLGCPFIEGTNFFNNTEACVFLGLVNGLLGSAYSNTCKNTSATGLGAVQVEPPTAGADGSPAPVPLQPQKLPLPASYSDAAITALLQKEGGTYAFLWIAIRNLYAFNTCSPSNGGSLTRYLIPSGFSPVNPTSDAYTLGGDSPPGVYYNAQFPEEPKRPYLAIFKKANTMYVVFRGTGSKLEWNTNFEYDRVKSARFSANEAEGEIHRGFLRVFRVMWPAVRSALDREVVAAGGGVTRVVFTGHSQGSPVAAMSAHASLRYLKNAKVTGATIEAVIFASPLPGNSVFVKSIAKSVNLRSLVFDTDIISKVPCQSAKKDKTKAIPACAAPPALVPTKTSEKTSIVDYQPFAGNILITATRMPIQQDAWAKTNMVTLAQAATELRAGHFCSFSCFLSTQSQGFVRNACDLLRTAPAPNTPCELL